LNDILQHELPATRILTYSYNTSCWSSSTQDTSNNLRDHSLNLLADLYADRQSNNALERPLIFICHGLGGIIVKKALASSSTDKCRQLRHRRSIFVSTYAIIFLATPHNGFNTHVFAASEKGLFKAKRLGPGQIVLPLARGSEILQDIEDQFAPLAKRFSTYCFWEQLPSLVDGKECFIVDKESAVPLWPEIEQAGLDANHSQMCKFRTVHDSGFKIILAALKRYSEHAVKTIRYRWTEDRKLLKSEAEAEATELLHVEDISARSIGVSKFENVFFDLPRRAKKMFTGRSDVSRMVQAKFFSPIWRADTDQHKIIVLYGLGGAGKTEFCLKFAEDNKDR
jgi:hypothetical protein